MKKILLIPLLASACASLLLGGCSSPPSSARTSDPEKVSYKVWFGTNRKPTPKEDDFTAERNHSITYGRVKVYIPEAHRFGETGSSFFQRMARFDLRDDRLRVEDVTPLSHKYYLDEIRASVHEAGAAGHQPQALFFLHGFNVSFKEAAIRTAQIAYDLRVPGPATFFSWPSRGSPNLVDYTTDEAAIEASEQAITDFMVDFAAKCGTPKVHVIAHSMGNRGLLRALQRISANAENRSKVKFAQIILAAPDLDSDLFVNLAHLYTEHAERTTVYASHGDIPVYVSARIHGAPRVGYFTPYTVAPGVDTVAVPNFEIDFLGHSYFAQAEQLLLDIHRLMRTGKAPSARSGLTNAFEEGKQFWRLQK